MANIICKTGDIVLIRSEITREMSEYWNSSREPYLGQVLMVTRTDNSDMFNTVSGPAFQMDAIERILTREEKEEWDGKERIEALKEKAKHLYYSPERVGALAIDIFGEERVDVVSGKENDFDVIILFPELTLTNSQAGEHIIKDLYVKFRVATNMELLYSGSVYKAGISMTGRRGKFTLKEFESNYIHSHLPAKSWDWSNFCLGSSQFKILLEETRMELTEDAWMKVFLSLPNYVKWESLEGGPHHKIANIKYKTISHHSELEGELARLIGGIPKSVWEINGDLNVIPTHPELREYFNSFSNIKQLDGTYDEKQYKEAMVAKQKELVGVYSLCPLKWKGKQLVPQLIEEPFVSISDTSIDGGVMDEYCKLLRNKSKTFLKTKNYNDARSKNYQKVFGAAGTFQ